MMKEKITGWLDRESKLSSFIDDKVTNGEVLAVTVGTVAVIAGVWAIEYADALLLNL